MAVSVTAASDLVDTSSGAVSVPKGTSGTVLAVAGPVSALRYQVQFTPSSGAITRWVTSADLAFADGKLGPARAYYVGKTLTISEIAYEGVAADFDGRLGKGMLLTAGVVELSFSDGTKLRLRNNRNAGDLDIELQ